MIELIGMLMGVVDVYPATVVVMVPEIVDGAFVVVTVTSKEAVASELTIPETESVSAKLTWGADMVPELPSLLKLPDMETA